MGPPSGFEHVPALLAGGPLNASVSFLNDLTVRDSVEHMVQADMLVTVGSGFTLPAAVVAWKPVVLYAQYKMGRRPLYDTQDWVWLSPDGELIRPQSIASLRSQIHWQHALVHEVCD